MIWESFWDEKLIEVKGVKLNEDVLEIRAHTVCRSSQCPRCQEMALRRHSFYTRQIADLPCLGVVSRVRVRCRRFFCDNDGCDQQIFRERLDDVAAVYARTSHRLLSCRRPLLLRWVAKLVKPWQKRVGL